MQVEEQEILSPEDAYYFRSEDGALLYLCSRARPDISHAVAMLTRRVSKPGQNVMVKLLRVLRYFSKGRFNSDYNTDTEGDLRA